LARARVVIHDQQAAHLAGKVGNGDEFGEVTVVVPLLVAVLHCDIAGLEGGLGKLKVRKPRLHYGIGQDVELGESQGVGAAAQGFR
jgi:hypothetical protein